MTDETNEPQISSKAGEGPDNVTSIKRGPGRPRGSTKAAGPSETPIPGAQARGPGGRFGGKQAAPPVDIPLLAKQLKGIHQMGAMMLGLPMLQLTDPEANMLADAFAAIAREYDIALSGKTAATLQLLGTAAMIYVPRMLLIDQYVKQKKAAARDPADGNTGNVVDLNTGEPIKPS